MASHRVEVATGILLLRQTAMCRALFWEGPICDGEGKVDRRKISENKANYERICSSNTGDDFNKRETILHMLNLHNWNSKVNNNMKCYLEFEKLSSNYTTY